MRRRGFTLIELLVVLGIIAILLGFLLPMFNRAHRDAKFTVCAKNEGQFVAAAIAYAMDNQGFFPRFDGATGSDNPHDVMTKLHDSLIHYGLPESAYFCPFTPDEIRTHRWTNPNGWTFGGYGWWAPRYDPQYSKIFPPDPENPSWPVNGSITARGPKRSGDPVGMISPLITDDLYLFPNVVPNPATFKVASAPASAFYQVDSGHMVNGRVADVNEGYSDGHVERVPATSINCCYKSGNAWVCR